jgi:hypothetical protein
MFQISLNIRHHVQLHLLNSKPGMHHHIFAYFNIHESYVDIFLDTIKIHLCEMVFYLQNLTWNCETNMFAY